MERDGRWWFAAFMVSVTCGIMAAWFLYMLLLLRQVVH